MINDNHAEDDNDIIKFYSGRVGEMSIKNCIRALKKNSKKDVRVTFVVTYNTTRLSIQ